MMKRQLNTKTNYLCAVLMLVGGCSAASAQMHGMNPPASDSHESVAVRIARARSAGPDNVSKDATIADMDSKGNMVVLVKGTNDFTCMPGDPKKVGSPAMCADSVAMKWNQEASEHKAKPSNTVPGIEYMLAGATQRSDKDPFDKVDPPIEVGPHWMILWPFDPKTSGLSTHHKSTGAYIMFAGTPWAHVHVMGRP